MNARRSNKKTALLIRQTLSLIADSGYPRAARRSIEANSLLLIHPTSQFTIGSKWKVELRLRQRDTIHFTFYGNRAFERPRHTGHFQEGRVARCSGGGTQISTLGFHAKD